MAGFLASHSPVALVICHCSDTVVGEDDCPHNRIACPGIGDVSVENARLILNGGGEEESSSGFNLSRSIRVFIIGCIVDAAFPPGAVRPHRDQQGQVRLDLIPQERPQRRLGRYRWIPAVDLI